MEKKIDSQIFQVIDDMSEYIASCKPKLFSGTEIIVDRERVEEYLNELRRKAPEEINHCRRILQNQETIINDAKKKADDFMKSAEARSNELLSQNEIMQRAYEQADEIVQMSRDNAQQILDNAIIEANAYRDAAAGYMEQVMVYLENFLGNSIASVNATSGALLQTLQEKYDQIVTDHASIQGTEEAQAEAPAEAPAEQATAEETPETKA